MTAPLRVTFVGGETGPWLVTSATAVCGEPLPRASRVGVHEHETPPPLSPAWILVGTTGHVRYVERKEGTALRAVQAGLGRPECTCAAFIPIRKSDAWWELAQDERRAIFEERSHHIAASLRHLPAIARRLHHSRELHEPFDFLTWFEYAPEHAGAFEDLVGTLRATEEWQYVVREVDVRLER